MNVRQRWLVSRLGLVVLLVCGSLGAVNAEDTDPPLPQSVVSLTAPNIPAVPAAVDAVLTPPEYLLPNPTTPRSESSQDFGSANFYDSQAADDFCIPLSDKSWEITNVDVVGIYNVGGYAVDTVRVYFYSDIGVGTPATEMYFATVTGGNLGGSGGSFALTLTEPARLGGNGCYWLSVRAVQPGAFVQAQTWLWTERVGAGDRAPSVYWLPGDPFSPCYSGYRPRVGIAPNCNRGTEPDFTFRLSGNISTNNLTPVITSMSPPGGLNEDVVIGLQGYNFAANATISWTVGVSPTVVFTPTIISASSLSVTIPQDFVQPEGEQAEVRVNNPAPCYAACYSNPMTFALENLYSSYLPTIRR
jgi:hypothetical protein